MGKVKIAVSRCLLGDNVRYDGGNKRNSFICDTLGKYATLIPLCPEVECHLAIPRPPIALFVDEATWQIAVKTLDLKHDFTEKLSRYAKYKIEDLQKLDVQFFILKSKSPSCGSMVAVKNNSGETKFFHPGIFCSEVKSSFPGITIIDENNLDTEVKQRAFLNTLLALN